MCRKVKGRKRDTKKPSGDTWYVYLLRCAGGSLSNVGKSGTQTPADAVKQLGGLFGKKKNP